MDLAYPDVNSAKDLNSDLLLNDYTQLRDEYQKRDNLDLKVNYQLRPGAMVWGKLGYMTNKGTGTPYSITGTNNAMACQGCGSILINYSGDPEVIGEAGNFTEAYYDKSKFSQPAGVGLDGFGTTKRNYFRRSPAWNVDLSLFKAFPMGRFRPEFRMDFTNIFNHVNWGAPNTTYTSPNFMLYAPANASGVGYSDTSSNTPGPGRIQLGFRLAF
jgi:hypothetical protein